MYAKVSKKGQVTIPKAIRDRLKIEADGGVLFIVEGEEIKLKGVPGAKACELSGSLGKYAKAYVPLETIREKIRGEIADDISREGLVD
ncbi:MAG: AbrB/MazE/SpoVT family DNA-binding domain-containing protein [Desulfobacterales bacterium]|nr:AbrB/MazE/SpoVT family DNA-binding domain-containing protein [Desulfobacterales bacterium]